MPSIIQLPLNVGADSEAPPVAQAISGNGAGGIATALDLRPQHNPFSLLEAEFDRESERLRMREAFWISLMVHAAVVLAIIFLLPKLAARRALPTALENFVLNHEMVFLQAPPAPKPLEKVQTDRISDQDRQAALRHPQPDAKTLQELRDLHAPGAPNKQQQQAQAQAAQSASPQMAASRPQAQQPAGRAGSAQMAQLENGPHAAVQQGRAQQGNGNPFSAALSPGSQIQQALRASAENRSAGHISGDFGDIPTPPATQLHSNLDILSDTMGVDFGPYLSRVLEDIRRNWYNLIPEEARAPLMKQGKVSIRFVITKDGGVAGMKVLLPSGDVALDRAAWGGITASNPFQPLPGEFHGPYLALACTFYYNPDRNEMR